MSRLTEHLDCGCVECAEIGKPTCWDNDCYSCKQFDAIITKLAAYEDAEEAGTFVRKVGVWGKILNQRGEVDGFFHEDCCFVTDRADYYCPHCGTKMMGEDEAANAAKGE